MIPTSPQTDRTRPAVERARFHKERIYASFTGLATLTVLALDAEHHTPGDAAVTLLVAILAISLAGFVAELGAHQLAHSSLPDRGQLRTMLQVAGAAIGSASIPFIALAAAMLGLLSLTSALQLGIVIYFATLLVVNLVAAARAHLAWRQRLISLSMLLALGVVVILMLVLAHLS